MRRRRECLGCGRRFTTFERAEPEPLYVRKRGGERQPFQAAKLREALRRAAHKRPVGSAEIDALVERIAARIRAADGELDSERVGELCLEGLRDLDLGAYLQFAGVDLADPDAIRAELSRVRAGGSRDAGENPANRGRAGRGFRPSRVGSSAVTPTNQREEKI